MTAQCLTHRGSEKAAFAYPAVKHRWFRRSARHLVTAVTLGLVAELAACAAPGSDNPHSKQTASTAATSENPADPGARLMLSSIPPCKLGGIAVLKDGLSVRYDGADPEDPQVCIVSWNGRKHRYLAGFWGSGRFLRGTPAERDAIERALTGPVGTLTSFEDTQADLWGEVTVEHVASPVLTLEGGRRRTIQLRIVRHDASGRPNVQRVSLHWVDVTSGVALRRQTVIRLPDGQQQHFTTWQVERLEEAAS